MTDTIETEATNIFAVPNDFLSTIEDRLAKLTKRAKKLGVEAPKLHKHGPTIIDIAADKDHPAVVYEATNISIEQPVLRLPGGWRLAATVANDGGVRTVMTNPTVSAIVPASLWKPGSLDCDHCHLIRSRAKSFYLVDAEFTKAILVGSTCMDDYLGHNAERLAQLMTDFYLFGSDRPSAEDFQHCERAWKLDEVLRTADEAIARWGWMSGNAAYNEGGIATKTNVRDTLDRSKSILRDIEEMDRNGFKYSPLSDADIMAMVEWAASGQVGDSDYARNLQAIATAGVVTYRTLGTAVSLVPVWGRHTREQAEKATVERTPSTWLDGDLKKRVRLTLELKHVATYVNDFGYSHVHRFVTPEGQRVVWSASREQDIEAGDTIVAEASIKAKEVDAYGPVTKVLRLTIKEKL